MTLPKDVYTNYLQCKANGDTKLSLLLLLNGRIRRLGDTMSTYRYITFGGTSWSARQAKIDNTILLRYDRLRELSHFSEISYGYILDYTDSENRLVLMSFYKFATHPNKDNWNIMCKLLTLTKNKFRLLTYIPKFTMDSVVRRLRS